MAKVKIKLNSAGVRRLLKSKEMQAICTEHAEEIAATTTETTPLRRHWDD